MRKDMNKVLTTRPRAGGEVKNKDRVFNRKNRCREKTRYFKGTPVDTSPKKESMRKRHRLGYNDKLFTDHIEPLHRYLRSQEGRPWNDVWSDICQTLKGTGLQAMHVKQHVKWAVDGIPHSGETFFDEKDWHKPRGGVVYVDEKGIVRRNPGRKKWKPLLEPKYVEIDGFTYAEGDHGWFRVDLSFVGSIVSNSYTDDNKVWDDLQKKYMSPEELLELYGAYVRCVQRYPLNKKQLRKLGLRKT